MGTSKLRSLLDEAEDEEKVSLAYAGVGDDGCHAVARYMRDNVSLQHLDMRGSNVRSSGLVVLAHAVKNCPSLVSLCLKWNNIGVDSSGKVSMRGFQALADALGEPSCTLQELDLRNNNLAECTTPMADILRHNMSLVTIDVAHNSFGEHSGPVLFEALRYNSTLVDFQLAGNNLTDRDLHNIATITQTNRIAAEGRGPVSPSHRRPTSPVHPLHAPSTPGTDVEVLTAGEAKLRAKLRERESSGDPADMEFYRSVGDVIDAQIRDYQQAKRARLETELGKRMAAQGLARREKRYECELEDLGSIFSKVSSEKNEAEGVLNAMTAHVSRIQCEKEEAMADRQELEEVSSFAVSCLERETAAALQCKAEIEAELYSHRRKIEDLKDEYERLRVYLGRCKADLNKGMRINT